MLIYPQKNLISLLPILVTLLLLGSCSPETQTAKNDSTAPGVRFGDFENASITEDHSAQTWFAPKKEYVPHYELRIVAENAAQGKQCAELHSTGAPNSDEFGNIMQYFDAAAFAGKPTRFTAKVRIESSKLGQAQMWMRVDKKDHTVGFFDNMNDRPITSGDWKEYSISGFVDSTADKVYIGCMLLGEGKVFFDDVHFDILTGAEALAVKPVDRSHMSNLDFEEPTLGLGRQGWFTPQKMYTPHYAVSLNPSGAYKGNQFVEITSTGAPNGGEFGNVMQAIDATQYRGKTVRFRAAVKVTEDGKAQLWMRVDRPNDQMGFFDNMDSRPITASQWKEYEIVGKVDEDANDIYIGGMLIGQGKAALDAVSFEVIDPVPKKQ